MHYYLEQYTCDKSCLSIQPSCQVPLSKVMTGKGSSAKVGEERQKVKGRGEKWLDVHLVRNPEASQT